MGENTKIEWATHTFNPWIGCTKVSPACAHCYAEVNTATRTRGVKWGPGQPRYRTAPANWKKPRGWDREAKALGVRPRVFCASLADWLDDEVPIEWLADLLCLIHETPNLDWLLLTKRPENWRERLGAVAAICGDAQHGPDPFSVAAEWLDGDAPNVWIGCTVENQEFADLRIPRLLEIPARVRFLSCEPLLGSVDLLYTCFNGSDSFGSMTGIHWVIAGGESGQHARPSHPDWFCGLRDQCQRAGVAFFFKQWGEYAPSMLGSTPMPDDLPESAGFYCDSPFAPGTVWRFGKKAAGRLLGGREWNDVPGAGVHS